ncbi:MAG: hypothetical protein NWR51_00745 [Akkermansiaceae bacterium]|nr:hypothetical protein [Akkermansiaceae bacterium]
MKALLLTLLLIPPAFAQSPVPQRGGNLPVFRTVLDERPRVIVVRLGVEHAVAFDCENGILWKAWQAPSGQLPVKLEGAVYDGKHGPQPTSQGNYILTDEKPQLSCADPTATLQYLGHSPQPDGTAIIRWAFQNADHENLAVIAVLPSIENDTITIHYKLEGDPSVKVTLRTPGSENTTQTLGTTATSVILKN